MYVANGEKTPREAAKKCSFAFTNQDIDLMNAQNDLHVIGMFTRTDKDGNKKNLCGFAAGTIIEDKKKK